MAPGSRGRWSCVLWAVLGLAVVGRSGALMTTVLQQECVFEEVGYDGDLVSGSFVVIDHGLSWSDDPGVELVVGKPNPSLTASLLAYLHSSQTLLERNHSHRERERHAWQKKPFPRRDCA